MAAVVSDPRDETIAHLNQGLAELIDANNEKQKRISELEALLTRVLRAEND